MQCTEAMDVINRFTLLLVVGRNNANRGVCCQQRAPCFESQRIAIDGNCGPTELSQ